MPIQLAIKGLTKTFIFSWQLGTIY